MSHAKYPVINVNVTFCRIKILNIWPLNNLRLVLIS